MLNKIITLVLLSVSSLLLIHSCDTTEPPPVDLPDTTSQNFSYETFEFGDGYESSWFNDVWIFDENNIWAVGYIQNDSVVNANIMRWNGNEWYVEDFQGTSSGIKGIWAVDSSNIFFANGAVLLYKNGVYEQLNFQNMNFKNGQSVHKLWGSSESNIWGVGPWGTIVHFDGTEWKKIEFDTNWLFYDITGDKSSGIAYAVARGSGFVSIIVKLETEPEIIFNAKESNIPFHFESIEMVDDNNLYFAGIDIGKFNLSKNNFEIVNDLPVGFNISTITATNKSDIYFFGDDIGGGIYKKKLVHYNGSRFSYFTLPERKDGIIGGSHSYNDLAISVEFSENKAYLIKVIRE